LSVAELLGVIRERGIELVVEGDKLRCVAPTGALTPELAAQIRREKAALVALLGGVARKSNAGTAIPRVPPAGRYPLSYTQRRAVLAGRINGALPTAFLLRGTLDRQALDETVRRIVARHLPLHTRFHLNDEGGEQEVVAGMSFKLPFTDLGTFDESERSVRLRSLLGELSRVEFDVEHPPLFRFHLIRLGDSEHVLHTAFNVLIFDGWSFDILWQELREGYSALAKGDVWPASPLPVSYEDYVIWQRKRVTEEIGHQARFWRETLGTQLPLLPLPTDRPRPRSALVARGGNIPFELPIETAVAVRRFAQQHAATPQIVMLASLYALVARMGATNDIVIASPVDARTLPSIEGVIGPFVNMLLLRTKVDLQLPFGDFVTHVRDLCLAAYENQEFPLEQLDVRSARSRGGFSPAFQVEFSYQQVSQRHSHMGGLSLSQLELESGAATNDLTLWVKDWGERVAGAVEFKLEIFDRETVAHWIRCYKNLVRELVRPPQQPMVQADLLGPDRALVEAQLAQASASLPPWLVQRLAATPGGTRAPVQLKVVDDRDELRPFGIPGHLAVVKETGLQKLGVQARLTHDGSLLEVLPDQSAEASAAPTAAPLEKEIRSELEMHLCHLFEKLLDLKAVGVEQDYFQLGGNSLIAVRLFASIQQQFGVRLPMATIIDASTPRQLAKAIKAKVPNRDSSLVRIKAGKDGPALFLVHSFDGETLLYRNLALLMPDEVAVYGVEPLTAEHVPMVHTTIEEMAGHYLGEIRKRQPKGPYFLGGLCAGGLIAFEVARQLEAQGEDIRCLALFEASPPQAKKRSTLAIRRWQRFVSLFHDVSLSTAVATLHQGAGKLQNYLRYELHHRFNRARIRFLCQLLRHTFPGAKNWPASLPAPTVRQVFAFAEEQYVPAKLSRTQVILYRAREKDGEDLPLRDLLVDPLFGWQELLALPVQAVDVPGGHSTLLQEGNVVLVASHLVSSFRSLLRESPGQTRGVAVSSPQSETQLASR
jgi:thioesterase domain-containing protein/acyl carrier protein